MNLTSRNRLEVTASLAGKELSFVLDTGGYSTLLDNWVRNEVKLPFTDPHTKIVGTFHDFTNNSKYTYATATNFKLGNYDAKGTRVGFSTLNMEEPGLSRRFAGFIGMDFLYFRSAIIDIGGRALYLKPYSTPR
jgi:hypothetical protein